MPFPRNLLSPRVRIPTQLHCALNVRQPITSPVTALLRNAAPPRLRLTPVPTPSWQLDIIRQASTKAKHSPTIIKSRNAIISIVIAGGLFAGYFLVTDSRSGLHRYVVPPLLRLLIPDTAAETAHTLGITALSRLHSFGIPIHDRSFPIPTDDPDAASPPMNPFGLSIELFGHTIASPVMIPAGLDKHAEAVDALFAISPGVGLVEVGCVTPRPQPGNPGVRVWRLPRSEGMLNRYGFNSVGAEVVARRLRNRVRLYAKKAGVSEQDVLNGVPEREGEPLPASLIPGRLLAVQVGKNASTSPENLEEVVRDYTTCVELLGPYADVLVVNVSSPNTPGLRTLQAREPLTRILSAVVEAADAVQRRAKPKVVVKVSPDEDSDGQIRDIVDAVGRAGVSGVIVGNTTSRKSDVIRYMSTFPPGKISKPEMEVAVNEPGGVSGPVLYPRMLKLVEKYRRELDRVGLWERFEEDEGKDMTEVAKRRREYWGSSGRGGKGVVVIASGGIRDGEGAIEAMKRGAGGVMIYTGMVYGGVGTIGRVAREMKECVIREGRRGRGEE